MAITRIKAILKDFSPDDVATIVHLAMSPREDYQNSNMEIYRQQQITEQKARDRIDRLQEKIVCPDRYHP